MPRVTEERTHSRDLSYKERHRCYGHGPQCTDLDWIEADGDVPFLLLEEKIVFNEYSVSRVWKENNSKRSTEIQKGLAKLANLPLVMLFCVKGKWRFYLKPLNGLGKEFLTRYGCCERWLSEVDWVKALYGMRRKELPYEEGVMKSYIEKDWQRRGGQRYEFNAGQIPKFDL